MPGKPGTPADQDSERTEEKLGPCVEVLYISNGRLTRRRRANELSFTEGSILFDYVQVEIKTPTLSLSPRLMPLLLVVNPYTLEIQTKL